MDAMITTAALAAAEKMINAALVYDPASRLALAELAPQVLSIKIHSPSAQFFLATSTEGIRLLGHYEDTPTTELQGSLIGLIRVLVTGQTHLKDTGVVLFGRVAFLAELQAVLKRLDIDWEEILSQLVGDIAAHQLVGLMRNRHQWAQARTQNMQRLTGEFLTEELGAIPSKAELDYFFHQVDELSLQVDRLSARVTHLLVRATALTTQQE